MVDIFLLIVDRDGNEGRRSALDRLEQRTAEVLGTERILLAENAWQEIEVWALAGVKGLPKGWTWKKIRLEPNPKEQYFAPYAKERGLLDEPGQGRTTLGREAAMNYARVRSRCQELATLEQRLRDWIAKES